MRNTPDRNGTARIRSATAEQRRDFVPRAQALGLAPGVEAVVHVPEMPGRNFPGTVTRLANALQPGTRTLLTEIDVPNPDHAVIWDRDSRSTVGKT